MIREGNGETELFYLVVPVNNRMSEVVRPQADGELVRQGNVVPSEPGLVSPNREDRVSDYHLLRTTKCMAVRNSSRLRQPSLVTSDNCQICLSS